MVKKIISMFLIGSFILAGSTAAKAAGNLLVTDTLPGNNKKPEASNTEKADETIKEVPKSRKQAKPLAVTAVSVQPVIVKPKIIVKPIVKVHL